MGWLDLGKDLVNEVSGKADELASKASRSIKALAFFTLAAGFILYGLVGWIAEAFEFKPYAVSAAVGVVLAVIVLFNHRRGT